MQSTVKMHFFDSWLFKVDIILNAGISLYCGAKQLNFVSQTIPLSIREKIQGSQESTETKKPQDGNTSDQPAKSDDKFFEDLSRQAEGEMMTALDGDGQLQNEQQQPVSDPTEVEDEGLSTQRKKRGGE